MLADQRHEGVEVVEQIVDPVDLDPRAGRAAVAAHVERPHGIAGVHEALGKPRVAIRVVGEPVVDHDDAAWRAGARPPALHVEGKASAALERQIRAIDIGGCSRLRRVGDAQAGVGRGAGHETGHEAGNEASKDGSHGRKDADPGAARL